MKKSMIVVMHTLFWLCFPVILTFSQWAEQFRTFILDKSSVKSPWDIFINQLASLFRQVDMGRDMWSLFNVWEIVVGLLIYVFLAIGVFYLYYSVFIPKAVRKGTVMSKVWPVAFLLGFPFLLVALLSTCTFSVSWFYWSYLVLVYSYALFFAVAGSLFRIFENWYNDRLLNEQLKQQSLQSELALLKSQINPHFLFNTLNNIDALIGKDAAKASDYLVKFSEMLRYMIYDSDADRAPLKSELQYLRNYVNIQQIQYTNDRLVTFDVQGDPDGIQIAPMLFIPFVENAFKHCTDKEQPEAIRFTICIEGEVLNFTSVNLFDPAKHIHKDKIGGVGLRTVCRRLELLYPKHHTLEINDRNGTYQVSLTIYIHED